MGTDDATSAGVTAPEAPATPLPKSPPNSPSPAASRKPPDASKRISSSSGLSSEGRFLPGTLLAERYRIVAIQGRGGMGEVYRADDLVLGQPVALKFLPEAAARNEDLLNRFRNEVRTARRVSHPNVCRVYDVGEADGQTFLSMEYVDGEDLATLLRRIGRLPGDKGLEIARQLCAGLAAAHKEGVLHRDLKPANVMLDSRGRAVLTDFGLAGLAENVQNADVRSGTPAYMAPEQLAGREVTPRSDIFSLGLVFYEIFTGKRAFEADTLADLVRVRNEKPLSKPSSWIKDLDPAVERVIMRCLDPDPGARPSTALMVSAALPGGDPLEAALAAGETPSPQLVAASGEKEGLSRRVAVSTFAALAATMVVAIVVGSRLSLLTMIRPENPPEVIAHKARDILKSLGYSESSGDSAFGFHYSFDFDQYAQKNDKPAPHWNEIIASGPPLLKFWYRQSPRIMFASDFTDQEMTPGIVGQTDPPLTFSGMVRMDLDYQGRLTYLEVIPPEHDRNVQPAAPFDWNKIFAAAGLEQSQFKPAEPEWNSLANSDARAAWTGTWPGTSRPLRIEAAAFHGQPVFFKMVWPWTDATRMISNDEKGAYHVANLINFLTALVILVIAAMLAWRSYREGKGDLQGAMRIAVVVFILHIILWLFRGRLTAEIGTFGDFIIALSTSLFWAGAIWILYMALEPFVRRHWPQSIISWSRLLAGRWKDPVVGRDVMFGVMLGLVWILIFLGRFFLMVKMGSSPSLPNAEFLLGIRQSAGMLLVQASSAIRGTLIFFLVLFLLRRLLRRQWLAVVVFMLLWAAPPVLQSNYKVVEAPAMMLIYGIAALVVVRFGFITLAVGILTANLLLNLPLTTDFSAWYATGSEFILLSTLAIAAWGFYTSLAGRKLLREDIFQ